MSATETITSELESAAQTVDVDVDPPEDVDYASATAAAIRDSWSAWLAGLVCVALVGYSLASPEVTPNSYELFWGAFALAAFAYGFKRIRDEVRERTPRGR